MKVACSSGGARAGRARDADDVAEFGEEHLVVRPLGSAGVCQREMKAVICAGVASGIING